MSAEENSKPRNVMQLLADLSINPFAVQLLAESILKSPVAELSKGNPKTFEFPVFRGDCAAWYGVRITFEAIPRNATEGGER